jgi:surface protein
MELSTVLINPSESKRYLVSKNATHIVFTDQSAPTNVKTYDVSIAEDGGVVRWRDGDTYFFSTQRPGVKVVAPRYCDWLFRRLEKLETIDVSMFDVSNVVSMESMFEWCSALKAIDGLEAWSVDKVKNMEKMFYLCFNLVNVDGIQAWGINHATNMRSMFDYCDSLTTTPSWYHDDND